VPPPGTSERRNSFSRDDITGRGRKMWTGTVVTSRGGYNTLGKEIGVFWFPEPSKNLSKKKYGRGATMPSPYP